MNEVELGFQPWSLRDGASVELVTKSRWWHGPQRESTLVTSGGVCARKCQKSLAERFFCYMLVMSHELHIHIDPFEYLISHANE